MTETNEDPKPKDSVDGASNSVSGSGAGNEDVVAYATYKKVLSETKNFKAKLSDKDSKLQEANAKLAEYEAAEEAKRVEEEKARGNFDKLIAEKEEKIKSLEGDLQSNIEQTNNFVKTNAFLSNLDGKLDSQYYGHIPLSDIKIDDDGSIDQESLTRAVSSFKESHPRLIVTRKADIPNTKTGSSGGSLSYNDWNAIKDPEEQRRRYGEVDWSKA